jgi:hypothetical protein
VLEAVIELEVCFELCQGSCEGGIVAAQVSGEAANRDAAVSAGQIGGPAARGGDLTAAPRSAQRCDGEPRITRYDLE